MRVPQELVDIIVDHLYDCKPTLKACSLVSPAWLDTSRYHLFYDIVVPVSKDCRSFDAFASFLDASPAITGHIRHLRFQHGTVPLEPFTFFTSVPRNQTRIAADYLSCILSKLPRLGTLVLDSVCLSGSETHESCDLSMAPLYQLYSVTLTNVRIEQSDYTGKYLFDLFTLFSCVKQLRLRNLSTSFLPFFPDPFRPFRVDALVPKTEPHRLHVESLSLDLSITTREYADIIHRSLDCQALNSLSVTCMQVDELPLVGQIIHDAAATLAHFEFNLCDSIMDDMPTHSDWCELHLQRCTALSSLVVHFTLEGYPDSSTISQANWTQVLELLRTVPTTASLETLVLNIIFLGESEEEQLGSLDWERMRETLRRFDGLKTIEFWQCLSTADDKEMSGPTFAGSGMTDALGGVLVQYRRVGDAQRLKINRELQDWMTRGSLFVR